MQKCLADLVWKGNNEAINENNIVRSICLALDCAWSLGVPLISIRVNLLKIMEEIL